MANIASPQFGLNGKSIYSNIAKPMEINLQFTVDNTNGLGITSLKSNGYVNNVFMNTAVAPTANNGFTNPDPAAGLVMIQLKNNFNAFLSSLMGSISANSGVDVKIDNSVLVPGQIYTITTLGNASLAKWNSIGLFSGITPAVGVSFVALNNGGAGDVLTSRVQAPSVSGISHMEMIGNPNVMTNSNVNQLGGQIIMAQILGATAAGDTTFIPKAPANGSIVCMKLMFDGSSVSIDGL